MTVKVPVSSRLRIHHSGDSSNKQPFKEENARLKTDISRLKIEKSQLREENSRLRAENIRLREELHFTREELREEREISEQKDIELARNNALYHMLEEEHLRLQFE